MGASQPLKRAATYRDLLSVPDRFVAEILAGELYASPRPSIRHAVAASTLGGELGPPFQRGRGGPGGWWILDEPELHLGDDVLVPDLAGWRRERLAVPPDEAALRLAPDWVCEVLSPSTERIDRLGKLAIYSREGVPHAWLVNPSLRTLEILRLESGRWTLLGTHADDARVRAEPFEQYELELGALWVQDPA
jgi:Uma2 family endonuclease